MTGAPPVRGGVVGMVLAAGLGKRLRPLTDLVPKPAVPVAGLPLIRYALARLAAGEVRRAVVNTHHLAAAMEAAARAAAAAASVELAVSTEPIIAGTGGALREARSFLASADAIVLWNGDVLFDLDVRAAAEEHRRSGALATLVLAPMPAGASYAAVEVDGGMAVRRIAGRGPGGPSLAPLHFTGVHVLSPALLDAVPAEPFECDVNRHVYPPLLAGGAVRGLVTGGYWNDLGTPDRYLGANLDVLRGRAGAPLPAADPAAGLGSAGGALVAPGACVEEGARLIAPALVARGAVVRSGAVVGPDAVVGAGCVVGRGAEVRRAVVWEGTEVGPGERIVGAIAAGGIRVAAT
ncbi:MAG TPA: NDP-sugar synthase [Anaeromyxobacteraceae bacterium]|nr:NDP-sugar synthase [Anaeromyxobacteraceae bacterium]